MYYLGRAIYVDGGITHPSGHLADYQIYAVHFHVFSSWIRPIGVSNADIYGNLATKWHGYLLSYCS